MCLSHRRAQTYSAALQWCKHRGGSIFPHTDSLKLIYQIILLKPNVLFHTEITFVCHSCMIKAEVYANALPNGSSLSQQCNIQCAGLMSKITCVTQVNQQIECSDCVSTEQKQLGQQTFSSISLQKVQLLVSPSYIIMPSIRYAQLGIKNHFSLLSRPDSSNIHDYQRLSICSIRNHWLSNCGVGPFGGTQRHCKWVLDEQEEHYKIK